MQRFLDLLLSSLALIILSPLLIPICIILKFTGEGKIFYLQSRVGKNQKIFRLYKFATMLEDSPNLSTGTVTIKDDPRILPVGKFLRKTKINELPQIINILFGDMSMVGPRPQTERCFNVFPTELQGIISTVRPGLSGIGSIVFREEEDILSGDITASYFYDNIIAPYKGRLEEYYVSNQGIKTYILVIFTTVWVVIFPKSNLVWRVFKKLPSPPDQLKQFLRV